MTRRDLSKSRREHLKNLRKMRKSKTTAKKVAVKSAVAEPGSLLTNLGLVLTVTVLVILGASAVLQDRLGSFGFDSISLGSAEKTQPAVDPSTIEVRVLNGCGVPGAGRRMTTHLRDLRFDVVESGNAENFSYTYTLVIGHSDRLEAAEAVARLLGVKRVSSKPDNLALVDVTVILGRDWEKFLSGPGESKKQDRWKKLLDKARSILGKE